MTGSEIEFAIKVLSVCKVCWADMVPNDGEIISDSDAITQAIHCLESFAESKETVAECAKGRVVL